MSSAAQQTKTNASSPTINPMCDEPPAFFSPKARNT